MEIREAVPNDAMRVADVHVRAWQVAYRGLVPEEYLAGLRAEDWAKRYTFGLMDPGAPQTLLALDGERLRGFATVGTGRDEDLAGQGEVFALYVDPPHWGKGAGVMLMGAARARLCEQGYAGAFLWVLKGNERARRFYELDGWRSDGCERIDISRGIEIVEFRMRRQL